MQLAYSVPTAEASQVIAQPGLSTDIQFISQVAAKWAIAALLHETPSPLKSLVHPRLNVAFVGSGNAALMPNVIQHYFPQAGYEERREWEFTRPFQVLFYPVEKQRNCPVCGGEEV